MIKMRDEIMSENIEFAKVLISQHKKVPISKFTDHFTINTKKFH